MISGNIYRVINALPPAIESSWQEKVKSGQWIMSPPQSYNPTLEALIFNLVQPHPPGKMLSPRYWVGSPGALLMTHQLAELMQQFRLGETTYSDAEVSWNQTQSEKYTLFKCTNYMEEADLDMQFMAFAVKDFRKETVSAPEIPINSPEDVARWYQLMEDRYQDIATGIPVSLSVSHLCVKPKFPRENDMFLVKFWYTEEHFNSHLFVSERLKGALQQQEIEGLSFARMNNIFSCPN